MADTTNQNLSNDEEDEVPVCDVCFAPKFISDVMTTIDSCKHRFCGYCLEQWSKQHDTCPVDRLKFTKIVFSNAITGETIDKQVIKPHNSAVEPEIDNENEINYLHFLSVLHSQIRAQQANRNTEDTEDTEDVEDVEDVEDDHGDVTYEIDHYDSGDYSELENEFDVEDEDEEMTEEQDEEVMEEQDDLE